MKRVRRYLERHFLSAFLHFFLPLFGIASLIFFVKLVSVTSVIKVTSTELLQLYIYILPQVLFFVLSISFYIAAVSAVYRLSYEFELIALFTLGYSPGVIIRIFARHAMLLSVLLLMYGLILIPQAKQLYKGFIIYKKAQIELNINPSEFGHKFGSWYLHVEKKEGKRLINVALYNTDQPKESFIIAQKAYITNNPKGVRMTLYDGIAYGMGNERLREINFTKMDIYDTPSSRIFHYANVISYWEEALRSKKREFDMTFFLFIALFPIASLFFIPYLGITNARYERRNIFLSALGVTLLYLALAFGIAKPLGFKALALLPLWMAAGYWLYRKKILSRY